MPAGHRVTATDMDAILDQVEELSSALVFGCVYKPADETVTSSATYQNDNDLFFTAVASGVYLVDAYIWYQAGATGQLKIKIVPPSGTMEAATFITDPSAVDWSSTAANLEVVGLTGTGGNTPLQLRATLFMGVTGGTVQCQWAQNVSNGTGTILRKGSRMTYARIG